MKQHKTEYFRLKSEIETLKAKIAEVNQRQADLNHQINEVKSNISAITDTLAKEDLAIERKSKISPPTLSIDQYKDHKNTLEELKAQLPALEQSIDLDNKELAMLQSELSKNRSAAASIRDLILVGLVEQSVTDFSENVGESFKKLVMAIIAVEGKGKGFNYGQKEAFKVETYKVVFEQIIPAVFADTKELPDLNECNQYVDSLIEKAA
jgi:DNA repair exonuclease SbcCD ATPase subunit